MSGYFVDYKEEGSEEWTTANEAATANRYLKVSTNPHRRPAGGLVRDLGGPQEAAARGRGDMPGFSPARGQPSWTSLSWLTGAGIGRCGLRGWCVSSAALVRAPRCAH